MQTPRTPDTTHQNLFSSKTAENLLLKAARLSALSFMTFTSNTAFGVTESGLVGYYPLNGDARDASGNQNHGEVYGNPSLITGRLGDTGSAYSFDGNDDYIWIPAIPNLPYLTASIWVRTTEAEYCNADSQRIIGGGGYDIRSHTCETWATIQYGEASSEQITFKGGYDATTGANRWHHLAITYDGRQLRSYIDGEEVFAESTSLATRQPISYENSGLGIAIGQDKGRRGWFFNGDIDDIRVYNRALNANEINELYFAGNALECTTVSVSNLDPADFEGRQIVLNCEPGYRVVGGGAECYDFANWFGRLTKSMPIENGWGATCMRYDYNGSENNEGAQIIKRMYVRCCR